MGPAFCAVKPLSVIEVKLLGRQIFNVLANDAQQAIPKFEELGSAFVWCTTRLGRAYPRQGRLTDIITDVLPRGTGPFQAVWRDRFESPRIYLAVGVLHIHMKECVRVLPFDT